MIYVLSIHRIPTKCFTQNKKGEAWETYNALISKGIEANLDQIPLIK